MTPRERYLNTLLFNPVDRIPFMPGWPRESTLAAWRTQGLAPDADWHTVMLAELGITPEPARPQPELRINTRMIPEFEEKILEHRDGHYIVQDWMGAIVEIADTFDCTYLRYPKDFVTRKWHKFPVESRADWHRIRQRYDPNSPGRHPADLDLICRQLRDRDHIVTFQVNGPFWQMREWCGLENLCRLMMDDPGFVSEMAEFWGDFISRTLRPVITRLQIDRLGISEDMAYKCHSMISPAMARRFLAPIYRRWVDELTASGCPLIDMDSDGYIGELIPLWIECGINVCDPIEAAAENDIVDFRRRFGRRMGYIGGIDKRAIAAGGHAIERELERVIPPLLADGGFIPSCDHAVPPDVSWPAFLHYARRLAQMTGWL